MSNKIVYTYTITDPNTGDVVTGLESRSLAREELQLVKKQGYPNAKIIQSVYSLQTRRQVR